MVIRGKSRGNGKQLAYYLLQMQENEAIRILDVDGQLGPEDKALHRALLSMSLSSELSRSKKGLYHAQINPAPGEDLAMTDESWLQATDILAKQLGMENQRRAIVLHTKKGRTHAHVVWERYDHDKGKMVSDSFSRLAQDRARKEMEAVFEQQPTPHRNRHRPELKAQLTEIWQQTTTGKEFISKANEHGYLLGEGVGRHPFMVIDENARSHDLARQLKGVRLKEVRERLRHEKLLTEKQAIEKARAAMDEKTERGGKEKEREAAKVKFIKAAAEFRQDQQDITQQSEKSIYKKKFKTFIDNKPQQEDKPQRYKQKATAFKDTKQNITEMGEKKDSYHSILERLDEHRAKELRDFKDQIEESKERYSTAYIEQLNSYKQYNKFFGDNLKGVIPEEFNKQQDAELLAKARQLEAEQSEHKDMKEQESSEKTQSPTAGQQPTNDEVKQDEKYVSAEQLQDLSDELAGKMKKPKREAKDTKPQTQQEQEREQLRNEFLQQLEDIEQEKQKNRDKGLEYD